MYINFVKSEDNYSNKKVEIGFFVLILEHESPLL